MNYIYTYHSPMLYERFQEACDNLSMMGVSVLDAIYAILRGIHHYNVLHFQGTWICDASYDFPFEDEPDAEINVENWIDYLTHYYEIMRDVITLFVQPLPHPPSAMLIAELSFDKMVISYVP